MSTKSNFMKIWYQKDQILEKWASRRSSLGQKERDRLEYNLGSLGYSTRSCIIFVHYSVKILNIFCSQVRKNPD